MAEKRMFAKTIIDSDAFLDMPQTTQLLYFHLAMRADDDGFINNPKSIMRNVKCSEDDLKILAIKKFIIPFDSGVVVIKHWKIHNYIAKDRYKETKYKDEKSSLELDENNAYTQLIEPPCTHCIQPVYEMATQVRLDKISIDKDNTYNVQSDDSTVHISKKDADEFFEKVWLLYPSKKGKGRVTDAKKKELYKLGEECIAKAIQRYKDELKKDDWRKTQNGSTFFTSGYVDYLDENYEPSKVQAPSGNNKFNNFEQRDNTQIINNLEQRLLRKDK